MLLAEVDPARVSLHVEAECKQLPGLSDASGSGKAGDRSGPPDISKRPLIVSGGGSTDPAPDRKSPLWGKAEYSGLHHDDRPRYDAGRPQACCRRHRRQRLPSARQRALEHADFVLFVGSRMGSVVTIGWTFPKITLNKRVAQIDIDPEIMANNYENIVSVQGDARLVLGKTDRHGAGG